MFASTNEITARLTPLSSARVSPVVFALSQLNM